MRGAAVQSDGGAFSGSVHQYGKAAGEQADRRTDQKLRQRVARQLQGGAVHRRDQQQGGYDEKGMQLPCQQKHRRGRAARVPARAQSQPGVEREQRRDGNHIGEKQDVNQPRAGTR